MQGRFLGMAKAAEKRSQEVSGAQARWAKTPRPPASPSSSPGSRSSTMRPAVGLRQDEVLSAWNAAMLSGALQGAGQHRLGDAGGLKFRVRRNSNGVSELGEL